MSQEVYPLFLGYYCIVRELRPGVCRSWARSRGSSQNCHLPTLWLCPLSHLTSWLPWQSFRFPTNILPVSLLSSVTVPQTRHCSEIICKFTMALPSYALYWALVSKQCVRDSTKSQNCLFNTHHLLANTLVTLQTFSGWNHWMLDTLSYWGLLLKALHTHTSDPESETLIPPK